MIKQIIKRALLYIVKGVPNKLYQVNITPLANNELLKNRTAIITGGTSGIGYAIAKAFLNSGATVIITGRDINRINETCTTLSQETNRPNFIFGITLDNTDITSFKFKLIEIKSLIGDKEIDILVNNAGVLGGEIAKTTEKEYDLIFDTNLKGVFFLSKLIGEYMRDKKIQGNILNIASSSSLRPAVSAYALSKWGLRGLTLGLAKVLSPYGITVNGIAPGPTITPMIFNKKNKNEIMFNNPIGRYAFPEEIANMAVFLTSEMGRTVVGDIVYMTGGSALTTFDDVDYTF